ncbi:MAG: PTS system mannose/fructose/sorbose family transporter subunit IID [Clostridium sp.]
MSNEVKKFTKKDINRAYFRWYGAGETAWNYEKMQGLGYCYTMLPFLEEIYKDEDELNDAVKNHMQFFNCNMTTSALIIGANLAIEEQGGEGVQEAVAAIKTGLMGPLAGVGDTLFGMTFNTVFGSIAAYMAIEGNPVGCFIWIFANLARILLSNFFMHLGYKEGAKVVGTVGTKLKNVTEAATILGMTVIGALIPTVVKAKTAYVFKTGEVELPIQDILDKIMPGLLPLGIVFLTYWLLGRKRLNSTKVIFLLIIMGILGSVIGFLG